MSTEDDDVKKIEESQSLLLLAAKQIQTAASELVSDLKNTVQKSQKRFHLLVQDTQAGMFIEEDGRFTFVNDEVSTILDAPKEEIIGNSFQDFVVLNTDSASILVKDPDVAILQVATKSKKEKFIKISKSIVSTTGGKVTKIGSLVDLTSNIARERASQAFSEIMDKSPSILMIVAYPPGLLYVNSSFTNIYGYDLEEVIGKNPSLLKSGVHEKLFYSRLWSTVISNQDWKGLIINKTKEGKFVEVYMSITPFINGNGVPLFFIAMQHLNRVLDPSEVKTILK